MANENRPPKVLKTRSRIHTWVLGILVLLLANQPAFPSNSIESQYIDSRHVISTMADALAAGRISVEEQLKRLGFGKVVAEANKGVGGIHNYAGFSSRTLLEYAYRSAESGTAGDGNRFLAVLRADAAKRSAGIATDPQISFLSSYSQADLKQPFNFSPVDSSDRSLRAKQITPTVDKAIVILSDHLSDQGIGRARVHILRHFQKPGFTSETFEKILLESASIKEALIKSYNAGLPPPTAQKASVNLLKEFSSRSGSLAIDPAVLDVAAKLQEEVPAEVERYIAHGEEIPSRVAQQREILRSDNAKFQSPGAKHKEFIANLQRPSEDPFFPPEATTSGGGGGGGGGGNSASKAKAASNYNSYMRRSFESPSGSPPRARPSGRPAPIPRSYRVATLSPRAARGVAAGGAVESRVQGRLEEVYWFPLARDDRFGRLIVKIQHSGTSRVVASRVLFADSFFSALSVLSDDYGDQEMFREGEILVVMSMDPESAIVEQDYSNELSRIEAIESEMHAVVASKSEEDIGPREQNELLRLLMEGQRLAAQLPRGIVIHPALHGRELAWSVARTDFWFNDIRGLETEAKKINGGKPMPIHFKQIIEKGGARTWQFYERDAVIETTSSDSGPEHLIVKTDQGDTTGRFAVSMFAISELGPPGAEAIPGESGVHRLPRLEKEVQPLLDWLSTNHPDFWRLNNFSEALVLLRWVQTSGAKVKVVDMDGDRPRLPTPDRIDLHDVSPKAGPPAKD